MVSVFSQKAIYNTKIMESMEKKVKSKIIGLKKIMAHLGYDLRVSATLYFLALATELSLFFFCGISSHRVNSFIEGTLFLCYHLTG